MTNTPSSPAAFAPAISVRSESPAARIRFLGIPFNTSKQNS